MNRLADPSNPNPAPIAVGDFVHVLYWCVAGIVVAQREACYGTDNAVEVLIMEDPGTEVVRWYHLEPGEYTIE